jgi:hypothetical protein
MKLDVLKKGANFAQYPSRSKDGAESQEGQMLLVQEGGMEEVLI